MPTPRLQEPLSGARARIAAGWAALQPRLAQAWATGQGRTAAARANLQPRLARAWATGQARLAAGRAAVQPRLVAGWATVRRGVGERWRAMPGWGRNASQALATLVLVLGAASALVPLVSGAAVGLVARAVTIAPAGADSGDLPALAERSIVLDAGGDQLAVLHGEVDRDVVPLTDIPEHVQEAVLAAEDRRFYEHDGYDPRAIGRALLVNLRAGEVAQGASTITQQVARQAFLDREESLRRKLQEIGHAMELEEDLDKDAILERYLNEVYFGSGAYGIAAAAEEYFRAAPADLTVDQAALLAGMIRSPERLDPREHPERVQARRDQVLAAMAEAGFVERAAGAHAREQPVEVEPPLEREVEAPYALEAVKREFAQLEELGGNRDDRIEMLFGGGLVIHTSLDRDLQRLAGEVVSDVFPHQEGPTAALVSLDPRTGAIRALHGGVDFEETQFDLATQGRRQPGSALKPIIAATALEHGLSPNAAFEGDGPLAFTLGGADDPWEVDNFGAMGHGTVDLTQATTSSVNTAFAQLILAVGHDETVETAERLGVDADGAFGPPESRGPSIVLGGLTHGVTPLELASAYGVFANGGRRAAPHLIERVENADGEVIFERGGDDGEQVLEPGVNATMVDLLRGVVDDGTGTAASLSGWDVIGKTGTTDDSTDAWFAGATATLSTAVWIGHPEEQVPMGDMTGGGLPASLWQAFSAAALEGADPEPFPDDGEPRDLPAADAVTVPELTGLPIGEALVRAAEAGLTVLIADGDGADPTRTVALQQPGPGATAAFGEAVTVRFSMPEPDPPPEPDDDEDDEEEKDGEEDGDDDDQGDGNGNGGNGNGGNGND